MSIYSIHINHVRRQQKVLFFSNIDPALADWLVQIVDAIHMTVVICNTSWLIQVDLFLVLHAPSLYLFLWQCALMIGQYFEIDIIIGNAV